MGMIGRGIKEIVVLDTCKAAMNDLLSRNVAGGRLGLSCHSWDPGSSEDPPPDLAGPNQGTKWVSSLVLPCPPLSSPVMGYRHCTMLDGGMVSSPAMGHGHCISLDGRMEEAMNSCSNDLSVYLAYGLCATTFTPERVY